jgi:hypothetical protein
MDEALLEIRDYTGSGYQPLIDFGAWRVAFLRYLDALQPDRIDSMERHMETDEVFVLLKGRGVLILGGNAAQVGEIYSQGMEQGKLYNVKRLAWHTILLSRDATVLLVENCDTDRHNSEYTMLSQEHRQGIIRLSEQEGFG